MIARLGSRLPVSGDDDERARTEVMRRLDRQLDEAVAQREFAVRVGRDARECAHGTGIDGPVCVVEPDRGFGARVRALDVQGVEVLSPSDLQQGRVRARRS
jgi:hypothetical protein